MNDNMFEKLQSAKDRYEEITHRLSEPDVLASQEAYRRLMKEHTELELLVSKYDEYMKDRADVEEAMELLKEKLDKDFEEMVRNELEEAKAKLEKTGGELKILLLPKDPNDEKNVIVEIRGGAGGEEAALFAGVLFRMYARYAERKNWKTEVLDSNLTEIGGIKEIVFSIEGRGAYSRLKFESGVHRVQRVPATEAGGRIHTSTVTVAVLAEVEEVDVYINPADIQIDTYRSGGAGGQHINKTESAIRITHLPTGIVVTCQDERSQHKNKDKAMKVLRSKLYDLAREKQDSEVASTRKNQVGTGERNERIRTYNYPQGRVTDHRIGLTLYRIDAIVDGDIDEIIDALITSDQAEKLGRPEDAGSTLL